MLNEEPFMVLTKDSLPKDPSCSSLLDLFYAYKDVLIQYEVNNHVEECLLVDLFKRKNIN